MPGKERLYDLSLFSPEAQKLMEQWRENAVLTRSSIPYIPKDQRRGLNFPPSATLGKTDWARTEEGNVASVKANMLVMPNGQKFPTTAREKICSDLADHVGLLVPPVQVWAVESSSGKVDYFSASLRIFPDSRDSPSDHLLLTNDSVSAMAVVDQWFQQMDRGRDNFIYGHPDPGKPLMLAFIDYSVVLYEPTVVLPFFYHPQRQNPGKNISRAMQEEMRDRIGTSPSAKRVMLNIETTPDRVIDDTVNRLPDGVFVPELSMGRDFFKDSLKVRRDNIRRIVGKAFTL